MRKINCSTTGFLHATPHAMAPLTLTFFLACQRTVSRMFKQGIKEMRSYLYPFVVVRGFVPELCLKQVGEFLASLKEAGFYSAVLCAGGA